MSEGRYIDVDLTRVARWKCPCGASHKEEQDFSGHDVKVTCSCGRIYEMYWGFDECVMVWMVEEAL